MTEILLVRHGQATLGGPTYDQLSEIGYQQARWLAEHLQTQNHFQPLSTQLYSGTMARHKQTASPIADALQQTLMSELSGFNEFDFEAVVMAFLTITPGYKLSDKPTKQELYQLLSLAMIAWADGDLELHSPAENWTCFHQRVQQAWEAFTPLESGRSIIVTSAGVIASILRHLLKLDDQTTIQLNLQIKNSSVTKILYDGTLYSLSGFNHVSHLELPDRHHAVTLA